MGAGVGTASIDENDYTYLVPHSGSRSLWHRFVERRYSSGMAATGVPMGTCLPPLLRTHMQSWIIRGLGVHLGADYIRFGRQLASRDDDTTEMFHGVSIAFSDCTSSSWFSDSEYCTPSEWQLRLHKAFLEPVPANASVAVVVPGDFEFPGLSIPGQGGDDMSPRPVWPGRGRRLCEEDDEGTSTSSLAGASIRRPVYQSEASASQRFFGASATLDSKHVDRVLNVRHENSDNLSSTHDLTEVEREIEQQLSMFFSNADYHMGLLCLPVPDHCIGTVVEMISQWQLLEKVTVSNTGQPLVTQGDFGNLRENAIYMPDLLLLGLDPDLASTLTPDWTWAKYPQGCGEVPPTSIADTARPNLQAFATQVPAISTNDTAPYQDMQSS